MPTLTEMLREYGPDMHLMIADLWGIEQDIDQKKDLASQMAEKFFDNQLVNELAGALSQEEKGMIDRLIQQGGKIQREQVERAFGIIREMGAGRRQKEQPDRNPISIAEALYYKGLIGTAFLNGQNGIEEYVFIPDDVFARLHSAKGMNASMPLSSVPDHLVVKRFITSDAILDHACILLAALRSGKPSETISLTNPRVPSQFLLQLLIELNLVNDDSTIDADQTRAFLEGERCKSFSKLIHTWRLSSRVNELRLLMDLEFEGKWRNEPQFARENLINILSKLPHNSWFSIESFIQWVHQFFPDYQRTSGEYDAWFIREKTNGSYLKGFESWPKVEGRLLNFMFTGPLYWMGYLDLGFSSTQPAVTVFKLSSWSQSLLKNKPLDYSSKENGILRISKQLEFHMERPFLREYHYQIARFCDLVKSQKKKYIYRITANSLHLAEKQRISIKQITSLIAKLGQKPIPPNVSSVLKNWQDKQSSVTIEMSYLIQVASPDILEQLVSAGLEGHILERISPTCIKIKKESIEKIKTILLETGYLFSEKPEV
jgi:hypothetical protein